MMRYSIRPLTVEAKARLANVRREHSSFKSSWSSTLGLLDREVSHLGPKYPEFVMQVDCAERDIRLDGMLRADARPMSPAIAVNIETRKKGDLLFVCGRFHDWQDNVRAIALGLEALRRVERYGIVQADEQYRGWQALPPGMAMPAAKMTVEEAQRFMVATARANGLLLDVVHLEEDIGAFYRAVAKFVHPDAGGDAETFRKLTEARDLLAGVS